MQKEFDKLDLEVYKASVFQLKYQSYQYFLDFTDIKIDSSINTATVGLTEGCDIVFEVSSPSVSQMRGQKHIIQLQKESGVWKIVADGYEDYLWRLIKGSKLSYSDLRKGITESASQWTKQLATARENPSIITQPFSSSLSSYHTISYYKRNQAVEYAHNHWSPETYNPAYPDFGKGDNGLDCTNFVNQAMY